ncbi:hypothetical protein NB693_22785 [Pantoea ananatis]|uniref:hypothetical protein n=1 Tax=Pantoea ananas TaxID=553 RepID=UPI002220ACE6|nr:hypothetical protein [Pantoea ananatis]
MSVHGVRNAWMVAVAPNMSTAQIAGSTASIDPIYSAFYYEEKKDFRRPVVAPGLTVDTYPYYEKGAYKVDQFASVRQNARRQRHVDQSISFNFYVPSGIRASTLLDLHMRPTVPPASSTAPPPTSRTRPSTGRTRSCRPTSGSPTKWT